MSTENPIKPPISEKVPHYEEEKIVRAREILIRTCKAEMGVNSPVTEELIKLNLEHSERVYRDALRIAHGEDLDPTELGVAAMLHDIAKLSSREKNGVDTFHHHQHGFKRAGDVLKDIGFSDDAVERISNAIKRHSDIPFIRRVLEKTNEEIPKPETKFDLALRDADTLDQLSAGGIHKIVHFRQNPNSTFYKEDDGNVQKAIASAQKSFEEALGVISTETGKKLAEERVEKTKPFFKRLEDVTNLGDFDRVYEELIVS